MAGHGWGWLGSLHVCGLLWLQLLLAAATAGASDLTYPHPPNPFAVPNGQPPLPAGAPRTSPDGGMDDLGLPGGVDMATLPGDAVRSAGDPGESAPAVDPDVLPMPRIPTALGPKHRGSKFCVRPILCLAALSAACAMTRPREAALVTAIDAHHDAWGHLLAEGLREEPVELIDAGLGCVAVHSELVWLGLLGQWLPLLPAGTAALGPWATSVDAPALLVLALTFFYLLRKLLPRSASDGHLSVSVEGVLLKGRLHSLLTAALSPVGLVHWLHAVAVLVVSGAGLADAGLSRGRLLGLYAAAGACSSLSCVATQLLLGRRAQPRSSVSGAAMGMLLLRSAVLPEVRPRRPAFFLSRG